jgi:predicted amidohydrolase
MERQVAAAAVVGAEVILFSECVVTGYDYCWTREQVRALGQPATGENCSRIRELAAKHGLAIIAGFVEREADNFYNSALVARPDGTYGVQRKHVLTKGELDCGLVPGPEHRTVFEFNGIKTTIIICADGGMKELHEKLENRGVQYRFCPTGGGGKVSDMLHETDLDTGAGRQKYRSNRPRVFNTKAILTRKECPYIGFTAANALGPVGKETCHQGHCMIVDNRRVMRAQIPGTIVLEHQQDQMIHAALNFE